MSKVTVMTAKRESRPEVGYAVPELMPSTATLLGAAQHVRSQLADCLTRAAGLEHTLSGRSEAGDDPKDSPDPDCLSSVLGDCQRMVDLLNKNLAQLSEEAG